MQFLTLTCLNPTLYYIFEINFLIETFFNLCYLYLNLLFYRAQIIYDMYIKTLVNFVNSISRNKEKESGVEK